jgi:hypothetical protein
MGARLLAEARPKNQGILVDSTDSLPSTLQLRLSCLAKLSDKLCRKGRSGAKVGLAPESRDGSSLLHSPDGSDGKTDDEEEGDDILRSLSTMSLLHVASISGEGASAHSGRRPSLLTRMSVRAVPMAGTGEAGPNAMLPNTASAPEKVSGAAPIQE